LAGCGKTRCGTLCSAGILPASDESKGVGGWKPALRPAPKEFFRSLLSQRKNNSTCPRAVELCDGQGLPLKVVAAEDPAQVFLGIESDNACRIAGIATSSKDADEKRSGTSNLRSSSLGAGWSTGCCQSTSAYGAAYLAHGPSATPCCFARERRGFAD
jgi:hypothetical protein